MAMAMGIISGVFSAVGALVSASAQAAAANYNAQVAAINARTALEQSSADAKMKAREGYRRMGAVRAAAAANGVDMTGSALDVASDVFLEQELEVRNIAYQGAVKSTDYRNQEKGYKLEAKTAMATGVIGALTGFVQGAGSALKLA